MPWWLLVAGVLFGLACGVKWSALFFLPFFAVLVLVWRVQARRSAGIRGPFIAGILGDLGWWALSVVLLSVVFYLATWTGWFVTNTGYFRHYRQANGLSEPPVLGALLNLMHYHHEAYKFHSGLTERHIYQSWPWQWLLLGPAGRVLLEQQRQLRRAQLRPRDPAARHADPVVVVPARRWRALVWFGIARRDWRAFAIGTGAVGRHAALVLLRDHRRPDDVLLLRAARRCRS